MNNKWNNNGECRVYLRPEQWSFVVDILASDHIDQEVNDFADQVIEKIQREVNLESVR